MTSAGGAGAMAAALGPRAGTGTGAGAEAEAEGRRRRLLRAVTRLQAAARGFLLRRRLRSVREEFEAVVLEIEGDLSHLRWSGRVLQLPRFGPEVHNPNPPNLGLVLIKSRERREEPRQGARSGTTTANGTAATSEPARKSPRTAGVPRSELQSYRKHLLMELLWIQQAIASRKNFLLLKRKLGIPERSGGIPEFLDWFGEALELQQRS
ncbi:IQ domain-containing protein C [Corvus moneduloides]|uniref:IQ domain-containing protein C n=1 Tax=Corvus moneduloides TaxID=1196302 RepID=UPI001362993F|nr:IQ domain-containing protein C [Corvus moneduloides]